MICIRTHPVSWRAERVDDVDAEDKLVAVAVEFAGVYEALASIDGAQNALKLLLLLLLLLDDDDEADDEDDNELGETAAAKTDAADDTRAVYPRNPPVTPAHFFPRMHPGTLTITFSLALEGRGPHSLNNVDTNVADRYVCRRVVVSDDVNSDVVSDTDDGK